MTNVLRILGRTSKSDDRSEDRGGRQEKLGQKRRHHETEKARAATEARCHGKRSGSNGGKVSQERLGRNGGIMKLTRSHAAWEERSHARI